MPIIKRPDTTTTNRAKRGDKPAATPAASSATPKPIPEGAEAPTARYESVAKSGASAAARAIGGLEGLARKGAGKGAEVAKAAVRQVGQTSTWEKLKRGARAAVLGISILASAGQALAQDIVPRDTLQPPTTATQVRVQLRGKPVPQDATKIARTPSYEVFLSGKLDDGKWVPDLRFAARTIKDPDTRATVSAITPQQVLGVKTSDEFKALVTGELARLDGYINPEKDALFATLPQDDRSMFAMHNIRGQRVDRLFEELTIQVEGTQMSAADKAEARRFLNIQHAEQFRGKQLVFDDADTKSYWSYGHDDPFVKVWETLLKSLPQNDARRPFVQNQIDHIFTHKYVESGKVDENNAEKTLGLVAIDKTSRHVVSMTKESDGKNTVSYETLRVPDDARGPHAGKFVVRDGDDHFFEGTRDKVPAHLIEKLEHKAAGTIVFRRPANDQEERAGFRFDWNQNRMINTAPIDTGWWGHCDIRALMETLLADMRGSAGVRELRAETGRVTEYTREHQLEALASMLNMGDAYYARGGGRVSFGEHLFTGARNDNVPTSMTMTLSDGNALRLDVRLTSVSERGDPTKAADLDKTFSAMVPDDKHETYAANPDVLRVVDGDVSVIDAGGRRIEGSTDGWTFDERGRPVEEKATFVIDTGVTSGERVLVGSELVDVAKRVLHRYYYDPATQEISRYDTEFVEKDGKYQAVESTVAEKFGSVQSIELAREMKFGDDASDKLALLERVAKTGLKVANDSDVGEQVWNGAQANLKITTEYRSPDNKWERIRVDLNSRYGTGKVGEFIRKLGDDGKPIETIETKAAVDFYWYSASRIAPLISERGELYVNAELLRRGVISLSTEQDKMTSLSALQDMSDIIYLGLTAREQKPMYTIVHEGTRYVYDDAATWRADAAQFAKSPINQLVSVGKDIKDNRAGGVSSDIKIEERGALTRIYVDVNLTHLAPTQLTIELEAPDGTKVVLHDKAKGTPGGVAGTYGIDLSGTALEGLLGKEIHGKWKLKIVDSESGSTGRFVDWGLHLSAAAQP